MKEFDSSPLFTVQEAPKPKPVENKFARAVESLASMEADGSGPEPMTTQQAKRFGLCHQLAIKSGIALRDGKITLDQNLGIMQTIHDCIDGLRELPANLDDVIAGREEV